MTVYNQIDYIIFSEKINHSFINAGIFGGAGTRNDCCIAICTVQVKTICHLQKYQQNIQ